VEYELLFFTPVSNEDKVPTIKKELEEILAKFSGKITRDFTDIGKRKLAYPIKRNTHAFFSWCWFTLEEKDKISEINRLIGLNDKVMRHIIVRAEEVGKPAAEQEAARAQSQAQEEIIEPTPEPPKEEVAAKPKAQLEDLDEKLNELLEENRS
jgi:small subunit ribosomal protein S6